MDADKLEVLRALPYTIAKVCHFCKHGDFSARLNGDWGTCRTNNYSHQKHTGPKRQLSISRYGTCHKFEVSESKARELGAFGEFMENKQ